MEILYFKFHFHFNAIFKCYVSEVLLWVKNNLATSGIPFKYSTVHFPLVPSGTTLKVNGAPLGDTSSSTAVTKTASFSVQSVLTLLVKVGQWSLNPLLGWQWCLLPSLKASLQAKGKTYLILIHEYKCETCYNTVIYNKNERVERFFKSTKTTKRKNNI